MRWASGQAPPYKKKKISPVSKLAPMTRPTQTFQSKAILESSAPQETLYKPCILPSLCRFSHFRGSLLPGLFPLPINLSVKFAVWCDFPWLPTAGMPLGAELQHPCWGPFPQTQHSCSFLLGTFPGSWSRASVRETLSLQIAFGSCRAHFRFN